MDYNQRKIMAIAFCKMIPIGTKVKRGRLKNLLERLEKESEKEMQKTLPISQNDLLDMKAKVVRLQKIIGWDGKDKHPMTAVSFALKIVDEFNMPKIVFLMNEITDYFERAGALYPACNWAGGLAADKWDEIVMGGEK